MQYMQAAQPVYCMHWCVEGYSFQPFLKLCFLVKWLIFSQRWNLAFCNDEYENAYHPQTTLRLTKVRIKKKKYSNTLFKRISALSQFYVFLFLTHPSFNLEIAFFAPFIHLFVFFRKLMLVFLSLKKKKCCCFFEKKRRSSHLNP